MAPIFCLIEGDPTSKAFSVDATADTSVDQLKKLIKTAKSGLLARQDAAELTLWSVGVKGEGDERPILLENVKSKDLLNPLKKLVQVFPTLPQDIINVIVEVPPASPAAATLELARLSFSRTKQREYKTLSVESTCRKFFDALAEKLSICYKFEWRDRWPTIGDLLYAKATKNGWQHQFRNKTLEERMQPNGFMEQPSNVPVLDVPLPKIFSDADWAKLKELDQKTNDRIHSAAMPKTSAGKYYVVVGQDDFNNDTVSFFKRIGVKAKLLSSEDMLVVKREEVVSDQLRVGTAEAPHPTVHP